MGIHILLQHSNRQHLHRLFQTHHTTTNSTINNNTINMTEDSRKGLGDKVQEKVTPQRASPQPTRSRRVSPTPPTRPSVMSSRTIRSLPVKLPLTRPLVPPTPTRTTSP